MPSHDKYSQPDFLSHQLDKMSKSNWEMNPRYVSDHSQPNENDKQSAHRCGFCEIDCGDLLIAGVAVEYADAVFCSESCLESWLDEAGD